MEVDTLDLASTASLESHQIPQRLSNEESVAMSCSTTLLKRWSQSGAIRSPMPCFLCSGLYCLIFDKQTRGKSSEYLCWYRLPATRGRSHKCTFLLSNQETIWRMLCCSDRSTFSGLEYPSAVNIKSACDILDCAGYAFKVLCKPCATFCMSV